MGAADVVPGVSGGTMAFILGIYQEFLDSIKAFLSPETVKMACKFQIKEMYKTLPWPFLLSLGLGILSAIALFSTHIQWLLANRLALILAFFFGLILGSIATVLHQVSKWSFNRYLSLVIGTLLGYVVVGLPVLAAPPEGKWYLVLCGAVAICAMVLPGISGSFILLLMGKYEFILSAVNDLKARVNMGINFLNLALFCAGLVVGIAFFSRFLSWLLKKYNDVTVALLIGFMLGSLRKVWPWKEGAKISNENILPALSEELVLPVLLAAAGFVIVLAIEYAAKQIKKKQGVQN
jgi:putative membrane protein